MRFWITILCVLSFYLGLKAQDPLNVVIISDAAPGDVQLFDSLLIQEISVLFNSDNQPMFTQVHTGGNVDVINQKVAEVYAKKEADVLIGSGILPSYLLSRQSDYPLPTISSIYLDNRFLKDGQPAASTSNVSNYTYINSPFDVEKGLRTLSEICKGQKIAILAEPNLTRIGIDLNKYFSQGDIDFELLTMEDDLINTLNAIPEDVGGVYVLSPLAGYSSQQMEAFFKVLIDRKLPAFSLFDSPMLEYGAYGAYSSSENLQKIPRRIALNVERIADGKDPKDFPVQIETFYQQLIINMETANAIGVYPDWEMLNDAMLININKINTERRINLKSVIAEALEQNLGYRIEAKQTRITDREVALAKSNYLPQFDAQTTGLFLDQNTVDASFGTKGTFNWSAGASLSQLILSEPALANITIQQLLLESQQQSQKQSELDVVLEVATSYYRYLQALALTKLFNENIKATNQNLNIAINKEKAGYSGVGDVYRWESELDLDKIDLNDANAQLNSLGFQLNEILNRPIAEEFVIDEVGFAADFAQAFDDRFVGLIENVTDLNQFGDFMVEEALVNLPEIHQIELAIKAQKRLLKSNKRTFYLPTVVFSGGYDYQIQAINRGEALPLPGVEVNMDPTWNAAFVASYPLFSGGSRRFQKQKTQIELFQLQDQRKEVRNLLELQVRSNLENLNASYNNLKLTQSAAISAGKNFEIIQNLYKEGQVNVTTLVDAQNAVLGAQINANNANYQFIVDVFTFQRSTGYYSSLATEPQNEAFIQRFIQYKTK